MEVNYFESPSAVRCIRLFKDSLWIALGDGSVQLRNQHTGSISKTLRLKGKVPGRVQVNCFHITEKTIWAGCSDGYIRGWGEKGKLKHEQPGHRATVRVITGNRSNLWTWGDDFKLVERDKAGLLQKEVGNKNVWIRTMIYVEGKLWMAAGKVVLVWSLNMCKIELEGHQADINCLAHTKGYVWSGGEDGLTCLWDSGSGKLIRQFKMGEARILHLTSIKDRFVLMSLVGDIFLMLCPLQGVLKIWQPAATVETQYSLLCKYPDSLSCIEMCPGPQINIEINDLDYISFWAGYRRPPCYKLCKLSIPSNLLLKKSKTGSEKLINGSASNRSRNKHRAKTSVLLQPYNAKILTLDDTKSVSKITSANPTHIEPEFVDVTGYITELEQLKKELKKKSKYMHTKEKRMRKKEATIVQKMDELQTNRDAAAKEILEAKKQVDGLTNAISKEEKRISKYHMQRMGMSKKIRKLKAEIAERDETISKSRVTMERLQNQINRVERESKRSANKMITKAESETLERAKKIIEEKDREMKEMEEALTMQLQTVWLQLKEQQDESIKLADAKGLLDTNFKLTRTLAESQLEKDVHQARSGELRVTLAEREASMQILKSKLKKAQRKNQDLYDEKAVLEIVQRLRKTKKTGRRPKLTLEIGNQTERPSDPTQDPKPRTPKSLNLKLMKRTAELTAQLEKTQKKFEDMSKLYQLSQDEVQKLKEQKDQLWRLEKRSKEDSQKARQNIKNNCRLKMEKLSEEKANTDSKVESLNIYVKELEEELRFIQQQKKKLTTDESQLRRDCKRWKEEAEKYNKMFADISMKENVWKDKAEKLERTNAILVKNMEPLIGDLKESSKSRLREKTEQKNELSRKTFQNKLLTEKLQSAGLLIAQKEKEIEDLKRQLAGKSDNTQVTDIWRRAIQGSIADGIIQDKHTGEEKRADSMDEFRELEAIKQRFTDEFAKKNELLQTVNKLRTQLAHQAVSRAKAMTNESFDFFTTDCNKRKDSS